MAVAFLQSYAPALSKLQNQHFLTEYMERASTYLGTHETIYFEKSSLGRLLTVVATHAEGTLQKTQNSGKPRTEPSEILEVSKDKTRRLLMVIAG